MAQETGIETGNEGQTTGGPGTQVQEVGNTGQSAGNQGQEIAGTFDRGADDALNDDEDSGRAAQRSHSDSQQMGASESRSGDFNQHNP
jgi:hypothetical protein